MSQTKLNEAVIHFFQHDCPACSSFTYTRLFSIVRYCMTHTDDDDYNDDNDDDDNNNDDDNDDADDNDASLSHVLMLILIIMMMNDDDVRSCHCCVMLRLL